MDEYFSGTKLYGDDFRLQQIEKWYSDEENGYSDLVDFEHYRYPYHALDRYYSFRHIAKNSLNVLGIGSALGHEFHPLAEKIENITIIEPGDAFRRSEIKGIPCSYIKPAIDGTLPFKDGEFDMVTCLSVLHHIPNVTYLLSEVYRCLKQGGFAFVREPIVSMGDWRNERRGLTRHERGIPLNYFDKMVADIGFHKLSRNFCCFTPLHSLWLKLFNQSAYNSNIAVRMDDCISRLLSWNYRYHRTTIFQKFAPTCISYVLIKQ